MARRMMLSLPSLRRIPLLAGTAALTAFLTPPALAEEADAGLRAPIVVTGRGLADTPATPAYGTREIGRERITSSASGRIEDVLSSIAGFQQFRRSDSRSSNPSAQGVTLRALGGNATSRALVLLDGVPMADPFFGYIPLSAIAPERLGSVRVTRGGGTGAFGSGSVAGVIDLTSADADTMGLISGSALVNNRGETELSGSIAPRLGEGFVVASGRWDHGKGFWTTPADQRVPASARAAYDSWSANIRAVAPLTDSIELQARGLIFDDHRTLRFKGADATSSGQDASIRLVGRGEWQFDALAYVQARDFSNVVISSSTFRKVLDQRHTPSTGIGGKFELRPPVGENHVLRLGADLRISDGELREEPYGGNPAVITAYRRAGGRNSDVGLFLEDDWTLGALVLTAGVRADRWTIRDGFYRETDTAGAITVDNRFPDRSGWDTTVRGGAVWQAGGGLALRAAAYSGVRLPTVNELYRPFVVFPVTTQANAALKNEELRGFEAGVDFAPSEAVNLSVTAFDNKVKHAIANVTIAPNLRERRNVGAVHSQGIELSAALRFGTLSFDGTIAFTDSEVEGSGDSLALDGLRPAQSPKVSASGTLAWRPREGWLLSATLRHIGAQFEDDQETDVLPAATTLDAYAEVPLSPLFSIVLRGENLTDETIITRNQGGSIDLGAPRTVWGGVKLRFGR
jgi:outer membrane receptor protein involved in Fe transport